MKDNLTIIKKFPENFRFQLTQEKYEILRSQIATLEKQKNTNKQGVFFDGQVFDAYELASKIIRSANKSIVLIDNYIDESVLVHLCKKQKDIAVTILTKIINKPLT